MLDRRREMGKQKNYEQVSYVWIETTASTNGFPYGTIDLKPFTLDCTSYSSHIETYLLRQNFNVYTELCVGKEIEEGADFSTCQYTRLLSVSSYNEIECGTREKVNTSATDGTYIYRSTNSSEGIYEANVYLSGTNTVLISSSTYTRDIAWYTSKTNYLNWKTKYDGTIFNQFLFKFYCITSSSGWRTSIRLHIVRITNAGVVVANIIPVRFKNTGRYGLLDTISGNWIDRIASGSNVYYFSGE